MQQLNSSLTPLGIPKLAHVAILEMAVAHIAEQLVDAYALAKKCNDEGRALMTRDIKVRPHAPPARSPSRRRHRTPVPPPPP